MSIISVVSAFGLVFFMFLVGLELDTDKVRRDLRMCISVSAAGLAVPAVASALLAILFTDPAYVSPSTSFGILTLFLTCALGISALPVLARILSERRMLQTRLGALSMCVAAVDDLFAWILLACMIAIVRAASSLDILWVFLLSIAECLLMWYVLRPLIALLVNRGQAFTHLSAEVFLFLCLVLIFAAWFTEAIGLSSLIGAFQVGLLIPRNSNLSHALVEKFEYFTVGILMPLYFCNSGLKTQFGLINTWPILGLSVLVIVVATVSKIIGITLPCMYMGMPARISTVLGVLMSCKGLIALIVVNFGHDYGVITDTFFAILVLMVLVTTMMTVPLVMLVDPPSRAKESAAEAAVWEASVEAASAAASAAAAAAIAASSGQEAGGAEEGVAVAIELPVVSGGVVARLRSGTIDSSSIARGASIRGAGLQRIGTVYGGVRMAAASSVNADEVTAMLGVIDAPPTPFMTAVAVSGWDGVLQPVLPPPVEVAVAPASPRAPLSLSTFNGSTAFELSPRQFSSRLASTSDVVDIVVADSDVEVEEGEWDEEDGGREGETTPLRTISGTSGSVADPYALYRSPSLRGSNMASFGAAFTLALGRASTEEGAPLISGGAEGGLGSGRTSTAVSRHSSMGARELAAEGGSAPVTEGPSPSAPLSLSTSSEGGELTSPSVPTGLLPTVEEEDENSGTVTAASAPHLATAAAALAAMVRLEALQEVSSAEEAAAAHVEEGVGEGGEERVVVSPLPGVGKSRANSTDLPPLHPPVQARAVSRERAGRERTTSGPASPAFVGATRPGSARLSGRSASASADLEALEPLPGPASAIKDWARSGADTLDGVQVVLEEVVLPLLPTSSPLQLLLGISDPAQAGSLTAVANLFAPWPTLGNPTRARLALTWAQANVDMPSAYMNSVTHVTDLRDPSLVAALARCRFQEGGRSLSTDGADSVGGGPLSGGGLNRLSVFPSNKPFDDVLETAEAVTAQFVIASAALLRPSAGATSGVAASVLGGLLGGWTALVGGGEENAAAASGKATEDFATRAVGGVDISTVLRVALSSTLPACGLALLFDFGVGAPPAGIRRVLVPVEGGSRQATPALSFLSRTCGEDLEVHILAINGPATTGAPPAASVLQAALLEGGAEEGEAPPSPIPSSLSLPGRPAVTHFSCPARSVAEGLERVLTDPSCPAYPLVVLGGAPDWEGAGGEGAYPPAATEATARLLHDALLACAAARVSALVVFAPPPRRPVR